MDVREIGWEVVDWVSGSGQGQVVCSCERGNKPSRFIEDGEFDYLMTINFSRRILLHVVS
jgi:hypothetical protein